MIYDERLSKLAESLEVKKEEKDLKTLKCERDFLEYVIRRLESEVQKKNITNGKVYISFISHSYGYDDYGYFEISELLRRDDFQSFASEYKIYFVSHYFGHSDYDDSSYTIVWDYEAYKKGLEKGDYDKQTNYEELIKRREIIERILEEENEKRKKEQEEKRKKEEEEKRIIEQEKLHEEIRRHIANQKAIERIRRKRNW